MPKLRYKPTVNQHFWHRLKAVDRRRERLLQELDSTLPEPYDRSLKPEEPRQKVMSIWGEIGVIINELRP